MLADYLVLNSAAILPVLEAAAYRLYRGTAAVVHAVHSRLSTSPPAAQHVAAVYQVHCSAKFAYQGPRRTSSDRLSKSFTKLVRTIVLMKQKASYQVRVYCTTSSLSGKVKLCGCYCTCHLAIVRATWYMNTQTVFTFRDRPNLCQVRSHQSPGGGSRTSAASACDQKNMRRHTLES